MDGTSAMMKVLELPEAVPKVNRHAAAGPVPGSRMSRRLATAAKSRTLDKPTMRQTPIDIPTPAPRQRRSIDDSKDEGHPEQGLTALEFSNDIKNPSGAHP